MYNCVDFSIFTKLYATITHHYLILQHLVSTKGNLYTLEVTPKPLHLL